MAFQFKLEQILTYRQNLEEQAQLNLTREKNILMRLKDRLAEFVQDLQRLITALEERKKKSIPAAEFALAMEGISFKEDQIQGQKNLIDKQQRVVEKARYALFERVKERKVIEKLKEKGYRDYLKESVRKDQAESDEKATIRFSRQVQSR